MDRGPVQPATIFPPAPAASLRFTCPFILKLTNLSV
jgi:hypothetical protein